MEKGMKKLMKTMATVILVLAMITTGQVFGAKSVRKGNKALNNTGVKSSGAVHIAGNPDLVVTMVNVTPVTPTVSKDMITIKVTVKNRGAAATSAACSLTMFLRSVNNAGTPISGDQRYLIPAHTNNIPILGPGAKREISKVFTTHFVGRKQISGIINTESLEPGEESNSQNNTYKSYFIVKPKPAPADLILHKIAVTSTGRIKIQMSNQGKAIPDYDFNRAWVKAEVHGSSPYKQLHLKDVNPNEFLKKANSPYISFTWPDTGSHGIKLTSGYTYTVTITLDCFPSITDSDRSNNTKTVTLSP